jgi:hypothetical protein
MQMAAPPFNFHIKITTGAGVTYINGEQVVKLEYVPGTDLVRITLTDGSKEEVTGKLARELIERFEATPLRRPLLAL